MAKGATVRDLRRRNRGRILRTLLLAGETTRADLARECSLSTATAANVVSDLIAEGLVQETGSLPSDGGRPISRLSADTDSAYFIGADVGESGITVELFDLGLNRVDRVFDELPSRAARPEMIAKALSDAVSAIRTANDNMADRLLGLGLGLPGIVETTPHGRTTIYAQTLDWGPVDLHDVYNDNSIPVYADNGAKTMATAEAWRGGARNVDHCVVALVGRGLGAGFIVNGTVLRGLSSSAGEWGHTKISIGGAQCACGAQGCLEAYVGGNAIVQRWKDSGGTPQGPDEHALTQLITAADKDDDTASRILDDTLETLGAGLANLVNLFNPEKLIIGGWTGRTLAAARMNQLENHILTQTLHRPAHQVQIEASQLGSDAVAIGAAVLPLQHLIDGTIPPPQQTKRSSHKKTTTSSKPTTENASHITRQAARYRAPSTER